MKMSDVIADFIGEMLSNGGGVAELQRKSLADRFSCVPSQINYVIETRFPPENGYLVESQRGGGGFIRIIRLLDDRQRTLLEAARGIGGRLSQNDAARLTRALVSADLLTQREGQLLLSACSDGALAEVEKDRPRPPASRDLSLLDHGYRNDLRRDAVPLRSPLVRTANEDTPSRHGSDIQIRQSRT